MNARITDVPCGLTPELLALSDTLKKGGSLFHSRVVQSIEFIKVGVELIFRECQPRIDPSRGALL